MSPDGRSFVTLAGMRQSTVWVHDREGERQVSSEGYCNSPFTLGEMGRRFTMPLHLPEALRLQGAVSYGLLIWPQSAPRGCFRASQSRATMSPLIGAA